MISGWTAADSAEAVYSGRCAHGNPCSVGRVLAESAAVQPLIIYARRLAPVVVDARDHLPRVEPFDAVLQLGEGGMLAV